MTMGPALSDATNDDNRIPSAEDEVLRVEPANQRMIISAVEYFVDIEAVSGSIPLSSTIYVNTLVKERT